MYHLRCLGCGAEFPDDGLMVRCGANHQPALLRTVYERGFDPDLRTSGLFRYRKWLPLRNGGARDVGRTAVFQSASLNAHLRTPDLWIAFNGYWPQRDATLPTATFKDIETAAVLARFPSDDRTLVTASAGNTAAALARACSEQRVNAIIVVPERAMEKLRFSRPLNECVRVVVVSGDATYDDAIAYAKALAAQDDALFFEGGATNVARRDGIGTTMLAVAEALGQLPAYFVAPIGSGSGAIAAHEMALRLVADGRFGATVPKLLLVQNAPSAPVYESWKRRSASLISYNDDDSARRARVRALSAPVLGMQAPPYAITGGLYDTLCESRGDVAVSENAAAQAARTLFETLEGVRIESAAAVAAAGLISQIDAGRVDREETIVLHVTGGSSTVQQAEYVPQVDYAVDVRQTRTVTAA